jgi:hypothetical protein
MKGLKLITTNISPLILKEYEDLLKKKGVKRNIKEANGRKNTGKGFLYREALEIALPILEAKYIEKSSEDAK